MKCKRIQNSGNLSERYPLFFLLFIRNLNAVTDQFIILCDIERVSADTLKIIEQL